MQALLTLKKTLLATRAFRFILVGATGFLIDALLLHIASQAFNLIIARAISASIATTISWILNRKFTFRSTDPHYKAEWLRYVFVYVVGGGLNFCLFVTLINLFPLLHQYPTVALAIAAITIAFSNYYFAGKFAFLVTQRHEA